MTAKAKLALHDDSVESVLVAAAARLEELERETRRLEGWARHEAAKNALLIEQKNSIELRLSTRILEIHAGYLDRVRALEEHNKQMADMVQGLVGGPTREEFDQLSRDYYAHSAGCG